MAQKPDGKSAKTERVTFTRPAAERIAKAVRRVESGNRDGMPWSVSPRLVGGSAQVLRMGTFTGAWTKTTIKSVTLRTSTATLAAVNLFANIGTASASRNCAIAKDGTAWYLIAAECSE